MEPKQFTMCSEYCTPHHEGDMLMKINAYTTVEEFNKLLEKYPGYKIENCGYKLGTHALSRAAYVGNVKLIYHIVMNLKGKHLLNLGDGEGWTPLYFAGNCPDLKRSFEASKLLLSLGADPNIASNDDPSYPEIFPAQSTPLYLAIEKTRNLRLVKLLLLKNAVVNPALSPDGEVFLAHAKHELEEKSKKIKALFDYKG